MKNSINNKGRSSSNAAEGRRKKASSSLKTLKPKQPTSEELRQVVGGLGSSKKPLA
jgi:hypothetical protein